MIVARQIYSYLLMTGLLSQKEELHDQFSKKYGNIFSDNDLLNNYNVNGLTMVDLVDNILWQIQSGPMALFTGSIVIMSDISCSLKNLLLKLLLHKLLIVN